MKEELTDRTLREAEYIAENRSTVRETAKAMGISKSTLHADITKRLKHIDSSLYDEVAGILRYNFSVRHIRGGVATQHKYRLKAEAAADITDKNAD